MDDCMGDCIGTFLYARPDLDRDGEWGGVIVISNSSNSLPQIESTAGKGSVAYRAGYRDGFKDGINAEAMASGASKAESAE